MTYHIKDALKKQFDLLSQASETCVDGDELSTLTHAMLQVCEFLERIEQDEAAQHSPDKCSRPAQMDLHAADGKTVAALRRGVLEHGIPDEPMVDDGEELRPCWHGGPLNGGGKVFERLIRDLEAAGAPADFFRGSVIRKFCATLRMCFKSRSWQTKPREWLQASPPTAVREMLTHERLREADAGSGAAAQVSGSPLRADN